MKSKPILLNKRSGIRMCKPGITIGILGTHSGAGATYLSLMLAFYMGEELERRTAFLECNSHHDMGLIQTAYEWVGEEADSFKFHRITCFKDVTGNRMTNVLDADYESYLLDFGSDFLVCRNEFLRCDMKVVVGGRAEWQLMKMIRFIEQVQTLQGSREWLYFIPQAKPWIISRLKREIGPNIYAIPFQPEPILLTKAVSRLFDEIFRPKTGA